MPEDPTLGIHTISLQMEFPKTPSGGYGMNHGSVMASPELSVVWTSMICGRNLL